MSAPGTLKAVAVLALAQGALGVLRAAQWFEVGGDLSRSGAILMPILGLAAFARGGFVALVALLYVLFAWAAFTGKWWTRAVGLAACGVNALGVVGLLVGGDAVGAALVWAIVPVLIGAYLLGTGQPALAPGRQPR
jgi:hypothetical protein